MSRGDYYTTAAEDDEEEERGTRIAEYFYAQFRKGETIGCFGESEALTGADIGGREREKREGGKIVICLEKEREGERDGIIHGPTTRARLKLPPLF